MSSNVFLFNATVRHQHFIQRFAGGEVNTYNQAVTSVQKSVRKALKGKDLTTLKRSQLLKLYAQIDALSRQAYSKQNAQLLSNMVEFSAYEADFTVRMLTNSTDVAIAPAQKALLLNTVFRAPLIMENFKRTPIRSILTSFGVRQTRAITRTIKNGILEGQSNVQIRKSIFTGLTSKQQMREVSGMVRTIVNHTANQSKTAVYNANSDVIKEVKYTATLDSRTTSICAGLDGKRFPVNTGPRPPMHFQCRSTMTPVIKKEFDLVPDIKTRRFSRGADGKRKLVDGRTNYNSWLKGQSKAFQIETLGKTRADLFRKGGLQMDKFTDSKFETLTLKQLKRREPMAFEKAGL